jgi:signal transduction histidine kinase
MQTTDLDPYAGSTRRGEAVSHERSGDEEQARQDVEIYKAELELRNEELRREFARRERAEAALVRADKLAVAGKLAAGLAHEIKNPLQAVMGYVQLALEALPQNEEVTTYLSMASQEMQRIDDLVNQLRDLSRPARAEDRHPVSLNEVVEKQLALNEARARGQGVVVEWQAADVLPPVWGVTGRLQQVFLNLLLNALEVMPEGGRLRARSEVDREQTGVWIHISDSGPGMADEVLPHIFELFYTTRNEGHGLGLFICDNIVAEHGGRIEVESRVGEGTTFSVWLPVAAE